MSDSFYLKRLKQTLIANGYNQPQNGLTFYSQRGSFPYLIELTNYEYTFHEEEYLGYQLIVAGYPQSWKTPIDSKGEVFTRDRRISDDDEMRKHIAGYSTDEDKSGTDCYFGAYVWKIGGDSDSLANLSYPSQGAVISGTCTSTKFKVTLNNAKKKVDLLRLLDSVHDELKTVTCDSTYHGYTSQLETPYNVSVGDHVYIPAFGRWRKGKIVKTTGSRFVIGYLTPSNLRDIKYKTLALSGLRIKP